MRSSILSLFALAGSLALASPAPQPAESNDDDCDVSYQAVTTTVVVTSVVEVYPTSTVYTSDCPKSIVYTWDGETMTSSYTVTSTLTSTYGVTITTTATGDGGYGSPTGKPYPPGDDEPTVEPYPPGDDEPTNAPYPPGDDEPTKVPSETAEPTPPPTSLPPYPVPGGNSSVPGTGTGTGTAPPPAGTCPAIWRQIASEMIGAFSGCNEPARASIRFAFHDAAGYSSKTTPYGPASGGADGSILYSDEEVNRVGNAPLPSARAIFQGFYANFDDQVSAADFVQMAGVIGVRMCGGPVYKTVVGREDDTTPCPEFMMPAAFGVNASYEALTSLWADKGINERELAALIGAHTVSRAFAQQANGIPPNSPQDSTPGQWDTNYYRETQAEVAPPGVRRFDSDINLSNATTVIGQAFQEFAGNAALWRGEYADAAYKMSVMGLGPAKLDSLIDCTSIVEELTA